MIIFSFRTKCLKDELLKSDKDLRFYLTNYVEKEGVMDPKALNPWKFVPKEWTAPAAKRDSEYLLGWSISSKKCSFCLVISCLGLCF